MIDYIFWTGVEILEDLASILGITYQELNVYVFIFSHPAVTLALILLWLRAEFGKK